MGLSDFLFGNKCTNCNKARTHDKSGICEDCRYEIEMNNEETLTCPLCSNLMGKERIGNIIIDKCKDCEGVFLTAEEFKKATECSDSGSGFSTGLALGLAIN